MLDGIVSWILDLLTDPVGFFSVVFSGALVLLYGRQTSIQESQRDLTAEQAQIQEEQRKTMAQQADIQESQRKLMEIEQAPTVLVDGFRGGTEDRGGIESFEIKLSNLGRNVAKDLELKVASGFHEDTPFLGGVETEPFEKAEFTEGGETEERGEETRDWRADSGDYLEPQERGIEFVVYDIPVRWTHEEDWYGGPLYLSRLREELSDYERPNTVRLKTWIQYRDHEDEMQEVELFDYVLPLCDQDGDRVWSIDWMLTHAEYQEQGYPLDPESSRER